MAVLTIAAHTVCRQQPAAGIAIVTAEARPPRGRRPPTQAWMLHDWLTVDLNEMLPAADLNIIIFEDD